MFRQSYHVMQEEEDVISAMDNLVGIATEDMILREEETEEEEDEKDNWVISQCFSPLWATEIRNARTPFWLIVFDRSS